MESRKQIQQRRETIVKEMLSIQAMKRGTLNEQTLLVPQKKTGEIVTRGPYFVLSRKESGKTVSKRVPAHETQRVRQEIAEYNRFMQLSHEFVELTERLGSLDQAVETVKKKPSLRSRTMRK